VVRWFVVTPDMHRVHHSLNRREADHNFGFTLSWWVHVFGTCRAQPTHPHATMPLGVARFQSPRDQQIDQLLLQPFR